MKTHSTDLTPRERLMEEYERTYRVNAELDHIHVIKENGIYHAYCGDWMGGRTPYTKLDPIFPLLLSIIDESTLMQLVDKRYIEPFIYIRSRNNRLHHRKLKEELSRFGITSTTVDRICEAYESIFKRT